MLLQCKNHTIINIPRAIIMFIHHLFLERKARSSINNSRLHLLRSQITNAIINCNSYATRARYFDYIQINTKTSHTQRQYVLAHGIFREIHRSRWLINYSKKVITAWPKHTLFPPCPPGTISYMWNQSQHAVSSLLGPSGKQWYDWPRLRNLISP